MKAKTKPAKPYAGFPLFAHATGRWAKKIKGKLVYFGPWADPDGALQKFVDEEAAWYAGRNPRKGGRTDGLTVRELCNQFLASKERKIASGDLVPVTFRLHKDACAILIEFFGANRLVEDVHPEEFDRLRASWAVAMAPSTLKSLVIRARGVFKFALTEGLIERPVCFGSGFVGPGGKVVLQDRHAKGSRMFESADIRQLIDAADCHMAAMIHLGANAGFGPYDCGRLPISAVNLDSGWVDYPRPKTGAMRRVPLWSETIIAIRESVKQRTEAKREADKPLLFITDSGRPWADCGEASLITSRFRRLLDAAGLHKPGLGFYGLRRGFETIGGDSIDQVAVDHIMGHSKSNMASVYRQRISDERLLAVTNHVRKWLFPDADNE